MLYPIKRIHLAKLINLLFLATTITGEWKERFHHRKIFADEAWKLIKIIKKKICGYVILEYTYKWKVACCALFFGSAAIKS